MMPDETFRELTRCFSDWPGHLANKNITLRHNIISWANYVPRMTKVISRETVSLLATDRQYSFQLKDGSIVQMVYDFSTRGRELKSAMLAYYENLPEDDLDDEAEGEILPIEEDTQVWSPRWLRLDFSPNGDGDSIHSHSHLHLSGFPETRISCAGVPGPRQFLESLLAWLYPEDYREFVLCREQEDLQQRLIDINRLCLHVTSRERFNSLLHLALPPSIRTP
jgi:hypothetical protein